MKRRSYLTTSAIAMSAFAGCFSDDPAQRSQDEEGVGDDTVDEESDVADDGEDVEEDDSDDGDSDDDGDDESADEEPGLLGTFDDFEDLGRWEILAGRFEADAERAYEGTQSVRLRASASEDQVRIRRPLPEPIDVREVAPALALATDDAANPVIQLQDASGDFFQFKQHVREGHPFVRRNFGHTAVGGDPDLSAITEIQVIDWSGDQEREFWIDDLHFVPRITEARVLIQFQGGFESDYTLAYPILEEYGLSASTFLATDRIRPDASMAGDRLTEAQVAELVDAGWSLGTVGARHQHLHQVEPERLESDLLSPLSWFAERGYHDAQYFAFPGGRFDQRMLDIVGEHYDLGFAGRHRAQAYATNPLTVTRISGGVDRRNLTAEQMIDAIDWTARYGGLTTITFYEMDDEDAAALEETAAHLSALVAAGEIELTTPAEIATEFVYRGDDGTTR
ncbi:polysaccharide deacetylase family protein [Natronorubrum sp. JWXQ-INN-674]|uniref:Polysaccharide deacetylase family protein n=1 Tax=Natronorubrum halalkaliphilum TaxID=2691917 RepID=A0A6B0VHS0_9EURY|nr:polysaccharide deacetylase family protein [Natronorubrum halalkaliphilum]MXV61401.1 polysaccharide deacetylase family protein [Natronorubrum halalkaliphilum]